MTEEVFKLARSRAQFSRLMDLCERQRQELEANPGPFLDLAYKRLSEAYRALDDARWILTGGPELMERSLPTEIRSTQSVMFERCNKALEVIDTAIRSRG